MEVCLLKFNSEAMAECDSKSICQIEGCRRPAVYALYKTFPNGQKVWLHVCERHEQMIGDENMNMGMLCERSAYKADSVQVNTEE